MFTHFNNNLASLKNMIKRLVHGKERLESEIPAIYFLFVFLSDMKSFYDVNQKILLLSLSDCY